MGMHSCVCVVMLPLTDMLDTCMYVVSFLPAMACVCIIAFFVSGICLNASPISSSLVGTKHQFTKSSTYPNRIQNRCNTSWFGFNFTKYLLSYLVFAVERQYFNMQFTF